MAEQQGRGRGYWAEQLADWAASGAGLREFAAERGLNARTLTWWRWRLKQDRDEPESEPVRLLPVEVETPVVAEARERRVSTGALEVRLPEGVIVRFDPGAELGIVGLVVRAVVEATRC